MKFPFSKRPGEPPSGGDPAEPQQRDLASEFRCLWTVGQFFSVMQRLQLQPERGRLVDLTDLGRRIEEARQLNRVVALSRLVALQRELGAARGELVELDRTIPVSVMRRFFERLGRFDRSALGEVLRFYLDKPAKSAEDRDKVDLLVTRYGSYRVETASGAPMWRSIDGLGEQVARLSRRADETSPATREVALADLREMRRSVFEVASFGDLIERKLLSRVRQYKTGLGDVFFAPPVLAEVAELNVAVHNKFQELYESEMTRLRLEADRLSRFQQDVVRLLPALDGAGALAELGSMTVRMRQTLQEVKRDIAERVLVDRDLRVSVEEEGVPLRTLVESCEEALRHTADIVTSLHGAYRKAELRGQRAHGETA